MKTIKILNPDELRIFRATYRLTQQDVANIMGYRTGGFLVVGTYEKGNGEIPKWESWEKLNNWEKDNGK